MVFNLYCFLHLGVISLNIGGVVAIYATQSAQKKQIGVLDIDVVADAKLILQVN